MKDYLNLVQSVLDTGITKMDRTGVGTKSLFGAQMRFDLKKGFPLLTNKYTPFHLIKTELLWFLSGSTNVKELQEKYNNNIWTEWADPETGALGPVYGRQWRSWQTHEFRTDPEGPKLGQQMDTSIDQIANVIAEIKKNPDSRRLIVSAWNVADLHLMALAPCHCLFQFYITPPNDWDDKAKLSCQLYQRSGDLFLGVPFNIASYALLTHMIAQVCDLDVGEFVHTIGDAHLYLNHLDQTALMLDRPEYPLPKLVLNPEIRNIDDFTEGDIRVENYVSHPRISAPVAV